MALRVWTAKVHRESAKLACAVFLAPHTRKLWDSVLQYAVSSPWSSDVDGSLGPPCSRLLSQGIESLKRLTTVVVRGHSNSGNALHELRERPKISTLEIALSFAAGIVLSITAAAS